jgi:hypothetical protein
MTTSRKDLKLVEEQLQGDVPEPMHSMLDKETRGEAIQKYISRKEKENCYLPTNMHRYETFM